MDYGRASAQAQALAQSQSQAYERAAALRNRLAEINSMHLSLGDGLTNDIYEANAGLTRMEGLANAIGQEVSSQSPDIARLESLYGQYNAQIDLTAGMLDNINGRIGDLVESTEDLIDRQREYNNNIEEGADGGKNLINTLEGAAGIYGTIKGIGSALNLSDEMTQTTARLNLMIIRTLPNGDFDYDNNTGSFISSNNGIIINTAVSLEDYNVTDDRDEGFDIKIDITIKKWVGYGTRTFKLNTVGTVSAAASSSTPRIDTKISPKSYTVKSGDTLYNICRAQLGDGNKYKEIAQLNNIENANLIYPGQAIRPE